MHINSYLDSTYLKTPEQSGLSEAETLQTVLDLAQQAVDHRIFAVMIRPDYVKEVKKFLSNKNTPVIVGTVIGFHGGTASIDEKLAEASQAIADGADELDFVINYQAYLKGETELVKEEFLRCTRLCIDYGKVAKWIIEIAALNNEQIADITFKISTWAEENFASKELQHIFVKSSTGFYKTEGGKPNGATKEGIEIMLKNAGKLPVKAAGGVRSPQEAQEMIDMGVKRIGTSSALALIGTGEASAGY